MKRIFSMWTKRKCKRLLATGCLIAMAALPCRASILFFAESMQKEPGLEWSWGYSSAPSRLSLHRMGDNVKAPVVDAPSYLGRHAILLRWLSRPDGDWGLAIASPGWKLHDMGTVTTLRIALNAPTIIEGRDLPDIALEDSQNRVSVRKSLANYVDGIDGDPESWQVVSIPVSVFTPGTQRFDRTSVKTIYFYQARPDGEIRQMWMDDIRFIDENEPVPPPPPPPAHIRIAGHEKRIDLGWDPPEGDAPFGYNIYGSDSADGPFRRVNPFLYAPTVYSDFLGTNGIVRFYRVTAINDLFVESEPSETVTARSYAMSDEELLLSIQEAAVKYFYDYGHPVSGLARERLGSGDVCTIGGTGFGLMNIMIGAERGYISREAAVARLLKILRFLDEKAERYHGVWPHWLNGETGKTIPFTPDDDGGDLVETSFLAQGLLTIRNYFNGNGDEERKLRFLCTKLWEQIEWSWYRRDADGDYLLWHWSPTVGWQKNHHIIGFNECMITYLLAIASPSHPVPASLFYSGWAGQPNYTNGNDYYGITLDVGIPFGGPLFFTHYSFLGFDPRGRRDRFTNYFENNRNIAKIHRAYAINNPKGFKGYGPNVWGMTASDNPWGYAAHSPLDDNGTITPTAAISSIPYVPDEAMALIRHLYDTYGNQLWGPFGFMDAFNLEEDWFADSVIAIDQGTIAPMIENHLTGLCWQKFMANPEIHKALEAIGFTEE